MTTNFSDRGSATIYQFPVRGRFATARRDETKSVNLKSLNACEGMCGSGWYHEAAIEESRRTRDPRRN